MRMLGTRKKNKGDYGLQSCTPEEEPKKTQAPTWPASSSGSGLGLEEADHNGRTYGWRREEGEQLLGGLRQNRSPSLPTRTPQWNVLWQQTGAFCSELAREQQGLGRTRTSLKALAASSVRFSGAGNSVSWVSL